jgi:hypothetical protein
VRHSLFFTAAAISSLLGIHSLWAQQPKIGVVEVYGTRSISKADIEKSLGVTIGGPLPSSKGDIEEKLEHIPRVALARLEAACCEEDKLILYVGVEERGGVHFDYRSEPQGAAELPLEVAAEYVKFLAAVQDAGRAGYSSEDLSKGHSLLNDEAARKIQTGFTVLADKYLKELREVIRTSSSAEQRAIAAYVIGYSSKKPDIVEDVLYAIHDSDETVRNNATRSLAALAVLAQKNTASGVRISPTWLIEMLNSVVWTDRNNAAIALVTLTENRQPEVLGQLRIRALPALLEMAAWTHLPHALPAYILAGRVGAIPEGELQDAWSKGEREAILKRVIASGKK